MLKETLKSLSKQIVPAQTSIEIVIVDNDPCGSSLNVVEAFKKTARFNVSYHIEKKRGIPFVRNTIITIAKKRGAAALAFIDDDELANHNWLEKLYTYFSQHKCLAVTGPVLTKFPADTPAWAIQIGLFDRSRDITGNDRNYAGTGNVLYSMDVFTRLALKFREEFALTGGSDSFLSKELIKMGYKIKWVDEAIVYETIPHSRLNLKWLIKRTYRLRINAIHQSKWFNGKPYTYFYSFLSIGKNTLIGLSYLSVPSLYKTIWLYKAIIHFVIAYSAAFGLLSNKKYDEYKAIHGE